MEANQSGKPLNLDIANVSMRRTLRFYHNILKFLKVHQWNLVDVRRIRIVKIGIEIEYRVGFLPGESIRNA